MTSVVVLILHQIRLNISTSKTVTKIISKRYSVILTNLHNAIDKSCEKISFHKQFKMNSLCFLGLQKGRPSRYRTVAM